MAAAALPPLREAEASAAAGIATRSLLRAKPWNAKKKNARKSVIAELDRRLAEIERDMARETALAQDAATVLTRLKERVNALHQDDGAIEERRLSLAERVTQAESKLAESEKAFSEATAQLAEISARRAQLERKLRDNTERTTKHDHQIASIQRDIETLQSMVAPI